MMRIIVALVLALGWFGAAWAHSPVEMTAPRDGEMVAEAPTEIALRFGAPVRLAKVTATHAGGAEADLDLSGAKTFATDFSLPCELVGSGVFSVTWRALAQDGHVMTGEFRFEVK